MPRTHRLAPTAFVILSCLIFQATNALAAGDAPVQASVPPPVAASATPALFSDTSAVTRALPDVRTSDRLRFTALPANAFAAQVYPGRPYPMYRDRTGSIAAMVIGAAAAITGTAVLVYANRPECSFNQFASGCGYGTKVIGSAVLSGGIASVVIGAITWR